MHRSSERMASPAKGRRSTPSGMTILYTVVAFGLAIACALITLVPRNHKKGSSQPQEPSSAVKASEFGASESVGKFARPIALPSARGSVNVYRGTLEPDSPISSAHVTSSAVAPSATTTLAIDGGIMPVRATASPAGYPDASLPAPTPLAQSPSAATASPGPSVAASVQAPSLEAASAPSKPQVRCGKALCDEGLVCCNPSCGTCVTPGEKCSQAVCGISAAPLSTPCGLNTCNVGEVCCDPHCGICARSQSDCTQGEGCMSPVEIPQSVSCGWVTCNTGLVCCNPSCGICAPYGEPCSQELCD